MKKFSLLSLSLISGAVLVLESGCTTVNSVENAQKVAQPQMVADKRVITDGSLNNAVRVTVNQANTPAGYLRIQITMENVTRSRKTFSYRLEWYDENAMVVSLPTASSSPVSLEGKETKPIVFTAPTARAKDFRIQFIEPVN